MAIPFDSSIEYPRKTDSRTVIRFQDCDPLRHLNNGKYFDYFFNAREDQVGRHFHVKPSDIFEQFGTAWVVMQHRIAYLRPALMGEWVGIHSHLIWYNENTIVIEYYMANDADTELKTVLWTTMRYVDVRSGKSRDHDFWVPDYLAAMVDEIGFENLDFETRLKQIKTELQKNQS